MILKPPGSDYEIEAVSNKSTNGLYVTPYNEKSESHYSKVNPGTYDVYWKDEKISKQTEKFREIGRKLLINLLLFPVVKEITLLQGGVHTFVLNDNDSDAEPDLIDFVLTKGKYNDYQNFFSWNQCPEKLFDIFALFLSLLL